MFPKALSMSILNRSRQSQGSPPALARLTGVSVNFSAVVWLDTVEQKLLVCPWVCMCLATSIHPGVDKIHPVVYPGTSCAFAAKNFSEYPCYCPLNVLCPPVRKFCFFAQTYPKDVFLWERGPCVLNITSTWVLGKVLDTVSEFGCGETSGADILLQDFAVSFMCLSPLGSDEIHF